MGKLRFLKSGGLQKQKDGGKNEKTVINYRRHCGWQINFFPSNTAIEMLCHIFEGIAVSGESLILEANFHEKELVKLHKIAAGQQYDVLTLVLRGDADVLYCRYLHRMKEENRHPVHLSTILDVKEDFIRTAEWIRKEKVIGKKIIIEATDFSYQENPAVLEQIDLFMGL